MLLVVSLLVLVVAQKSQAGVNLLKNPDFESLTSDWSCAGCHTALSTDSHTGNHSVIVTKRRHNYSGPGQNVAVHAGHRYYFQAYIKLLNQLPGHLYHQVDVKVDYVNGNGHHVWTTPGHSPYIQQSTGWNNIGGDFLIPSGVNSCHVYILIPETGVNYLLDSAELQEIPPLTNFRSEADDRIEKLRKANVTIKLSGEHIPTSGLSIQLVQTYSEFITGSAIDARMIVDPGYKKYQDFFYNNFEWGLPSNALKWTGTEHREGHIDYTVPFRAVDELIAHGKKVKGHNIFWDVRKSLPHWQWNKTGSELKPLMEKRIHGVVGGLKGKLQHWDVNNENLHGDFYEQKLNDSNITMWMFRETHKADPGVKLFLNDYNIVTHGALTVAYKEQARTYKESGVPVGGVGIQSHISPPVDLTFFKFRLDEVAKAGLPIMITELDVNTPDEDLKAQVYEDLYRLYYSHPAVEGIIQWHYWSGRTWRPQAVLAEGPDITPNKAGKIVRQLVWGDWRTNQTLSVPHDNQLHTRAFKGNYNLRVKHQGEVIHEEQFTLSKEGVHLTIKLTGTESHPEVSKILVG